MTFNDTAVASTGITPSHDPPPRGLPTDDRIDTAIVSPAPSGVLRSPTFDDTRVSATRHGVIGTNATDPFAPST